MRRIVLVALAVSIATPALAKKGTSEVAPNGTAASQQAAPAAAKAPEKTCRTYPTSGSHMKPERLCLTRDEWRKFDDAN